MIFMGAGAFVIGVAIRNEAIAQQKPPSPEPICYCGVAKISVLVTDVPARLFVPFVCIRFNPE
jgi:hypothetical protein